MERAALSEDITHITKETTALALYDGQSKFITPYGGQLVNLIVSEGQAAELEAHANKSVQSKHYQRFTSGRLRASLEPHLEIQEMMFFGMTTRRLKILMSLLQNRLFILSHTRLTTAFFDYYTKTHLVTDEAHCERILVSARVAR